MKKNYFIVILALSLSASLLASEPVNVKFTCDDLASVRSRNVESEIREQPDGKLYENLSRSCMSYGEVLGDAHLFTVDASLSKIVEGDDGCLYVYNPVWSYSTQTWMQLEKSEGDNNYVLRTPHIIYSESDDALDTKYYLRRLIQKTANDGSTSLGYDRDADGNIIENINFTWKDGVLTMEEDCLMGVITDAGAWNLSADYDVVISTVTDELITFDATETESYFMSYYDTYGMPQAAVMAVKIDEDTIYIGNFPDAAENAFIKGTLKNGKAIFPSKQYVGPGTTKDYNMYFFGADVERQWSNELEEYVEVATMSEQFEFIYDAENGSLVSGDVFLINPGKKFTSQQTLILSEPAMEPWVEVAATPTDPIITYLLRASEESYGWGWIDVTIPVTDLNGVIMNPNKLFYNIYLDDSIYAFSAPDYPTFTEPTTDIPYLFNSYVDGIFVTGQDHSIMFQFDNYDRMGVQTVYYGGGEVRKSNIVYTEYNASVKDLEFGKTVESVVYTDLSGRQVLNPAKGIYIKQTTYTDGTAKISKVSF